MCTRLAPIIVDTGTCIGRARMVQIRPFAFIRIIIDADVITFTVSFDAVLLISSVVVAVDTVCVRWFPFQ